MIINVDVSLPSWWLLIALPVVVPLVFVTIKVIQRFWLYATIYNDVPGPDNSSWVFGNYIDFYREDVCTLIGKWMRQYGGAYRYWAFLGERRLVLSDPVALQHVLVTNWTNYSKNPAFVRFIDSLIGTGLLIAEGEQYKRQKYAIQKGFTYKTVHGYHPIFLQHARNFRRCFLHRLDRHADPNLSVEEQKAVLTDVSQPSKRAALDSLSDTGFGESLSALDEDLMTFGNVVHRGQKNAKKEDLDAGCKYGLAHAYDQLSQKAASYTGKTFYVLFDVATWFVPELLYLRIGMDSHPDVHRAKEKTNLEASNVFRRAYDREITRIREEEELKTAMSEHVDWQTGEGAKADASKHIEKSHGSVIGMLIRALMQTEDHTTAGVKSSKSNKKGAMYEDEVRAQIKTLMFAGHDTTGTLLSWFFWIMGRYPDVQQKLRRSIISKRLELGLLPLSRSSSEQERLNAELGRHALYELGDPEDNDPGREMSFEELESIQYLDWCLQESLRLYGPVHTSSRTPIKDDVIPVDPAVSPNIPGGKIRVKAGASVDVPLEALNHNPLWWGEDAALFVPERWGRKDLPGVGQFPNRWGGAAFSFGTRACIGLKFVMAELRAIVAVVIPDLTFEDSGHQVCRTRWIVSTPFDATVGREQCPVLLRRTRRDEFEI